MPISDAQRREAFEKIANAKGMPIRFNDEAREFGLNAAAPSNMHLDLNMVQQVISDAVIAVDNMLEAHTNDRVLLSIREKLLKLSRDGSTYEKVTFAFSRGRYIFPEDVELMARSAAGSASLMSSIHLAGCRSVCNFVCTCVCGADSQQCEQLCETICHDICDIAPPM